MVSAVKAVMLVGTSAIDSARLRALTIMVSIGPVSALLSDCFCDCSCPSAGAASESSSAAAAPAASEPLFRDPVNFMSIASPNEPYRADRPSGRVRASRRRLQKLIDDRRYLRRLLPERVVAQSREDLHLGLRQRLAQARAPLLLHERVGAAPDEQRRRLQPRQRPLQICIH